MDHIEKLKQTTLLYVEDDSIVRGMLAGFLSRRCKEVWEAENGKRGLELYRKHEPDVVVTDIEMPVMNGLEMINEILNINSNQIIIITTAYDDEKHKSDKVLHNIIKPFMNSELVHAISECLEKRS